MSKEEVTKKMNDFLGRKEKSDAERKVETRLVNGAKQMREAQKHLQALREETTKTEGAIRELVSQLQAMWDLALEYEGEHALSSQKEKAEGEV